MDMSELITHHKRKYAHSNEQYEVKRRNRETTPVPTTPVPTTPVPTTPVPTTPVPTTPVPDKDDNIDDNKDDNKDEENIHNRLNKIMFNLIFTRDIRGARVTRDTDLSLTLPCNSPQKLPCSNPLCDHDDNSTNFQIVDIDKITSSNDLIKLGKSFHCKKNMVYKGINLRLLCNIVEPLTELNNMIGLDNVKNKIVNQIMFFLRGYHVKERCNKCIDCAYELPCPNNRTDMLHTVITGPPGVGKTQVARIIGKIYCKMGILSKDTFTEVGREDLIAQYLGQTTIKTKKKITECTGGVMFIDEVYSLGSKEQRDSFSKECIDTLNRSLSNITDLLCIVAGYEKDIEECFFSYNAGLRRRFTFSYDITGYTPSELYEIFCLKVKNDCWELKLDNCEVARLKNLFKNKYSYFPSFGGDIETLFLQCKICHSRNTNIHNSVNARELYINDIQDGFKSFTSNRKYDNIKPTDGVFTSV